MGQAKGKIGFLVQISKSVHGGSEKVPVTEFYLHYFMGTAHYISEYDGEDTMYGRVRFNVYPP